MTTEFRGSATAYEAAKVEVSKQTQKIMDADKELCIHGFWPIGSTVKEIVWDHGKGSYLWDTEGRQYFDFSSQLMNVNIGHCVPEVIAAIKEALDKYGAPTSMYGYTTEALVENCRKLKQVTPEGINHFHFSCNGSDAIDTAVHMALLYWQAKGLPLKQKIIGLYHAYHGISGPSRQLTNTVNVGFWGNVLQAGFIKAPRYYCYRCPFGLTYPDCDIKCARYLEHIIQMEGPGSIAAFIAESAMGASGIVWPPDEYWPIVREICSKYDILMIADEVMSGFCRSGRFFAQDHWGIKPDIMAMAKAIAASHWPYAATGFNDKVFEAVKDRYYSHGYTFGGHPVGAAASSATIDYMVKNKVAENAAKLGEVMEQRFEADFRKLPCVGFAGGKGCFQAIELVKDKKTKEPFVGSVLEPQFTAAGLYLRNLGEGANRNRICTAPHCTATVDELNEALDKMLPILAAIKV